MTTLQGRNRRPNGHSHEVDLTLGEAQCPYCGQPISRKEFKEIRARIETEERARITKVEQTLKDRFTREQQQAQVKAKGEVERAKKEAAKVAEVKITAIRSHQEATIAAHVRAAREAAEKKMAAALTAEKVKAFEEKTRLTEQLAEMQRRLERKTAHELGDPAEVDLFDQLVAAFPDDQASRVAKGVRGPDIVIEIVHNGAVVGSIVIDCKNHKRWSNSFTAKLRADQVAESADFAILSTAVFPAGARQLHVQDSVIVADPARVVVLTHLLRRQIVDNFMLKLGAEARNEKADRLYDFVLSPTCDDLFDKLLRLGRDAQALDASEARAHRAVWEKRAELFVGILAIREQFVGVVADIVGGGR